MEFSLLLRDVSHARAQAALTLAVRSGIGTIWVVGTGAAETPRSLITALKHPRVALVVEVDPGDDAGPVQPAAVGVAVSAAEGWLDGLRAVLAGERENPAWVFARDVGDVALAARAGVGVVLPELENPDLAAELVEEYEAELAARSARAIAGRVNARCAATLELPSELDDAVGLVERFRQAGVSEILLHGAATRNSELLAALIGDFDDDEVRAEATARAERLAPSIAAMQASASAGSVPQQKRRRRRSAALGRRIQRVQQRAVGRMSDRQLGLVVGSRLGVRMLVGTMARRFRPDRAEGFVGSIEFIFATPHGEELWTIECGEHGARARRGGAEGAELKMAADIADFLRIAVGEVSAPNAVITGQLDVRGDFALAIRMGELFDGPRVS